MWHGSATAQNVTVTGAAGNVRVGPIADTRPLGRRCSTRTWPCKPGR